jgi:hypothetical protein
MSAGLLVRTKGMLLVLPRSMITGVVARNCYVPLTARILDTGRQVLMMYTISPASARRPMQNNANMTRGCPFDKVIFRCGLSSTRWGRPADLGFTMATVLIMIDHGRVDLVDHAVIISMLARGTHGRTHHRDKYGAKGHPPGLVIAAGLTESFT